MKLWRRKNRGPHPVITALRNRPTPQAMLIPSFQPVLDAVNRPEIAATYEVIQGDSPSGYVWVKPELNRT